MLLKKAIYNKVVDVYYHEVQGQLFLNIGNVEFNYRPTIEDIKKVLFIDRIVLSLNAKALLADMVGNLAATYDFIKETENIQEANENLYALWPTFEPKQPLDYKVEDLFESIQTTRSILNEKEEE